jgi:hypothetical protein
MRPRLIVGAVAVVAGVLLVIGVAGTAAPAPDPSEREQSVTPLDRNAQRAHVTLVAIQQHFRASDGHFQEVFPSSGDTYTTLWPLTQQVAGMLFMAQLPDRDVSFDARALFESYWDGSASPPGYSATFLSSPGDNNRKFFDDNAWTGLDLLQVYRATGDIAALDRARQVFNFTASGWDTASTDPDPGGVWWSQQNPNPRFAHRNTISTASSAELAARLFDATGRGDADYLDWATQMYTWADTYMRGPNGLYGDHMDLEGKVDPAQLSYNQGTMIGAGVLLYRITGDTEYLTRARTTADTSLDLFGPEFSQPPAYNAIFFRNLLLLEAESGDGRYQEAMQVYADEVWDKLYDPSTGLFNFVYGRSKSAEPHRLVDQAAMLQIYALLALGPKAADVTI